MVKFDVESDGTFLRSLDELGTDLANEVLDDLFGIAATLSWQQYCEKYKWREHTRIPVDTYPGAIEYFIFDVPLSTALKIKYRRSHIEIYALNYQAPNAGIILCAVAK